MPPEIGALDFASDGTLYVSLRRGDIVTATPSKDANGFQWKRFATGFHNGCGMHIVKPGHIIISQMAELTEVIDTDGDGTADEYNYLKTDIGLSGNYHETNAICPDGKGGLFIAGGTASHNGPTSSTPLGKYSKVGRYGRNYSSVQFRGWVMHRAADGTITPFSSGYRMHNGIEFSPETGVWCGDNQGDWRAASPVYNVTADTFSGHPSSLVWDTRMATYGNPLYLPRILLDDLWNKPAFHLPHGMIRSCAEPVFDTTGGKFGPFTGQMLVPDQSGEAIVRCMPEMVDGAYQGAAVDFFRSNGLRRGNNRLTFSPEGDTLYVGQTGRGWGKISEGIQRIRFTGKVPMHVLNCSLTEEGFDVTFTKPVTAPESVAAGQISASRYRYEYGYKYGGGEIDKASVAVKSAKLGADGRTVHVVVDELLPNYIYKIGFNGAKAGDEVFKGSLVYTLNRLRRPATDTKVTIDKSDDRLTVKIGGELFTEYRHTGLGRPILYPINNASGTGMTRDWPIREDGRKNEEKDHPHHQSLFIGHQGMNGANFWHRKEDSGDIIHQRLIETRSGYDRGLVRTLSLWKGGDGKPVCSDTRELAFGVVDGARFIDLELNMHASHGDLTFEEFKDGFIGLRMHPHLRLTAKPKAGVPEVFGKVANSEGVTGKDVWGKRAKWVHYYGKVEGKDAGVAFLAHPDNIRTPTWWHARDYGLVSANPFGPKRNGADGAYTVPQGQTLTLRYRFLFHDKADGAIDIAKHFEVYAASKLVPRTKVKPIPEGVFGPGTGGLPAAPEKVQVPKNIPKRGGVVTAAKRRNKGKSDKAPKIVAHGLAEGGKVYGDRDYRFTKVPDTLRGADLLMSYNNDKKQKTPTSEYDVTVSGPSTLLLMIDTRVEGGLKWLKSFEPKLSRTKDYVHTEDCIFRVYTAPLNKGTITFPGQVGNEGSFYSIGVMKK
jgi:hypothetical protein